MNRTVLIFFALSVCPVMVTSDVIAILHAIFDLVTALLKLLAVSDSSSLSSKSRASYQLQSQPSYHVSDQPSRYPFILVPGFQSSRLEGKMNGSRPACDTLQDWHSIFQNNTYFGLSLKKCFMEYMQLFYDTDTRHTYNGDGINIRPYEFGKTAGTQYVDVYSSRAIMAVIVEYLVTQNYTIDKDIRGAPADFRKSHADGVDFLADFQKLIEETFQSNGNTPVYLLSHSMGCSYTLYFLQLQPQLWKDKYIKGFIALSGIWGGSMLPLVSLVNGYNFALEYVVAKEYTELFRGWSAQYSTLAAASVYGNRSIVSYNGRNYTASDWDAIFALYNITNASDMYADSRALTDEIPHPEVDVYCVHGDGQETIETFVYTSEADFPDSPSYIYGNGDGDVDAASCMACQRWSSNANFKFNYTVLEGASHSDVLFDNRTLELLGRILSDS